MGDAGMKSLRIEISPKVMLGGAVIKGTRLPVDIVIEKLVIFLGHSLLYSWLHHHLKLLFAFEPTLYISGEQG